MRTIMTIMIVILLMIIVIMVMKVGIMKMMIMAMILVNKCIHMCIYIFKGLRPTAGQGPT